MNFIGHAHVALWSSDDPRFVLGAMLPDFAAMAGARLSARDDATDAALVRGIALHHRTDEVFHGSEAFLELMQDAMNELTAQGVRRGSARAVGHIGIEMLIDGELVQEPEMGRIYPDALAQADALPPALFRGENAHVRFGSVHRRLSTHGVPFDYRDVDAVTLRLARVLAPRPRLALEDSAERIVRAVLREAQRRVVKRLPGLLDRLRGRLTEGAHL